MRWSLNIALITLLVGLGPWSPGDGGEPSTFQQIVSQYEKIRLALLHDGLDGVSESAQQIRSLAADLEGRFDLQSAGVGPEGAAELRKLLPSIREASGQVGRAETITDARESFAVLSKALVQYRKLVADPAPAVAFCSMAQKVWLQPSGEIGNPYYGQSMARCGEFVSQ